MYELPSSSNSPGTVGTKAWESCDIFFALFPDSCNHKKILYHKKQQNYITKYNSMDKYNAEG